MPAKWLLARLEIQTFQQHRPWRERTTQWLQLWRVQYSKTKADHMRIEIFTALRSGFWHCADSSVDTNIIAKSSPYSNIFHKVLKFYTLKYGSKIIDVLKTRVCVLLRKFKHLRGILRLRVLADKNAYGQSRVWSYVSCLKLMNEFLLNSVVR